MGLQSFKNSRFCVRNFWTTRAAPFQYALLVTSSLAPKLLHLWSHRYSLPPVLYLLYMPTFLGLDIINAVLFWILVHVGHARPSLLLKIVRGLICLIILGTSSMQIAFYLETGGEIKWGAAGNFAHDPAGIKVLLSGSLQACLASTAMVIVARIVCQPLYNISDTIVRKGVKAFTGRDLKSRVESKDNVGSSPVYFQLAASDEEDTTNDMFVIDDDIEAAPSFSNKRPEKWYTAWITRVVFLTPLVTILILWSVRPTTFPYAHMSGSLPYTLSEIWISSPNLCAVRHAGDYTPFPLPKLIVKEVWEQPKDKFPGWMPSANVSSLEVHQLPNWLPKDRIDGFERWYNESAAFEKHVHRRHGPHGPHGRMRNLFRYDPVQDPLRISNLDQEVLKPVSDALKDRKIAIKHVVLLTLESTRGDIFPLKKGSHVYNKIVESHGKDINSAKKAEMELSQLTANAELLTGQDGGFTREESKVNGSWRALDKDRGGLNVLGSWTGSTTSFKSVIGAHCGVGPLPVDFTVESKRKIYQPCIPQILGLLNYNKPKDSNKAAEVNSMPWRSIFAQSITDQFDHQDDLNMQMGWSDVIVKENIMDPHAKHPLTEKESNYFGYPETQIKPYLLDLFTDAKKNNQRLFLSHMTSSTHHPWNTPEGTPIVDFIKTDKWGSEHTFNRYLNTVKYADNWIGQVMDILQDLGVAEETLVVMVGDHGYAFPEDSPNHSTFENGHIANIRVPLVFHHPQLPRIQLPVNATSISIIPTILDLLVTTDSLSTTDKDIASNLIHQYEGQSLLRPYLTKKGDRQAWNIAVLNAGGAVLSVGSAAYPYRLIIPVCTSGSYRFTDTNLDHYEKDPLEDFSIDKLVKKIRKTGVYNSLGDAKMGEVEKWLRQAEKIGEYWVVEQRRRWRYRGGGTARDMDPGESSGMGQIKKGHWWET
ncbi:alkaline-phosphatase-like protein [Bisporella sp. PMI_857]|nr:alkaline-phosphatase-like protein [Bisporella sp. PMI_857]